MNPEQRAIYTYQTNQPTNNTAVHQNRKFNIENIIAWPWTY